MKKIKKTYSMDLNGGPWRRKHWDAGASVCGDKIIGKRGGNRAGGGKAVSEKACESGKEGV